jgi:UDP-glucose 4-epimerase
MKDGGVTVEGRRVLVTGGRGFIGAHLLRRLASRGAEVHAVSRTGREAPGVTWWQCDLTDAEATTTLLRRVTPDVVLHLASEVAGAREPGLVLPMLRANLAGAVHLMTAAVERSGTRVVLAGSMEEPKPGEAPSSPYAAAKVAATGYAEMFHSLWGLPVTTLRIAMAYGPDQPDHRKLIPYVITSLLAGRAPELGDGTRAVDWVYIDDVVEAFVAAASSPAAPGAVLEIGSGVPVTINEVVSNLVDIVGSDVAPRFGAIPGRTGESARIADPEGAAALIGWRPTVSLPEGLWRTVRWYGDRQRLTPIARKS